MGTKERLWDKTHGWFEGVNINYSFNCNEPNISTRFQPGGVASFTINKLAYKITDKGIDESGLGRWAWTNYQGKGN